MKPHIIDLPLEVLCCVTPEKRTMTVDDMADVCECSRDIIFGIERRALAKLRKLNLNALDYL